MRALVISLVVAACGCSTPEFRPVDADGAMPVELAAAWYDLTVDGRDLGDAKVWSHGAPARPIPDLPTGRQLLIGLRVKNDGDTPMRLDLAATELEVHLSGRDLELAPPRRVDGDVTIPARAVGRIELVFALPAGFRLYEVVGYQLSWALEAGDRRITRSTAFRRARELREVRYVPYDPYYGPWIYDPWWGGWGVTIRGGFRGEP